ncbi:hypothetical protein [Clostridium thailandense]|uniref:hypothetical protein n=1 Tax=Clostridium thailandense TaxID=2794346 RepID=UPI00398926B2
MKRIKSIVMEVLIVIAVFFMVCIAGLVDIKAGESPSDTRLIKQTNITLEGDKKNIEDMSRKIQNQSSELEKLKKEMNKLTLNKNTEEWNNAVISYNNKLMQYNKDLSQYNSKLDDYNKIYSSLKAQDGEKENAIDWVRKVLGI